MKFTLTIEDGNPELLSRLAAVIAGATATVNEPMPVQTFDSAGSFTPPAPVAPPVASEIVIPAPAPVAAPVDNTLAMHAFTPAAPIAPAAPVTADKDASGLPWDERIHSGAKSLTADGNWRRRKGVDDATFEAIAASLRGSVTPPAPVTMPSPPVAPTAPPPPPMFSAPDVAEPAVPAPPAFTAPPPAAPAAPVAPAPMPASNGPVTLFDIMTKISPLMTAGKLPFTEMAVIAAEMSQQLGRHVASVTDVGDDPAGCAAFVDALKRRNTADVVFW